MRQPNWSVIGECILTADAVSLPADTPLLDQRGGSILNIPQAPTCLLRFTSLYTLKLALTHTHIHTLTHTRPLGFSQLMPSSPWKHLADSFKTHRSPLCKPPHSAHIRVQCLVSTGAHADTHTHTHRHMPTCTHTHTVHMHTHTLKHTRKCTRIHTHTCRCTHTVQAHSHIPWSGPRGAFDKDHQ